MNTLNKDLAKIFRSFEVELKADLDRKWETGEFCVWHENFSVSFFIENFFQVVCCSLKAPSKVTHIFFQHNYTFNSFFIWKQILMYMSFDTFLFAMKWIVYLVNDMMMIMSLDPRRPDLDFMFMRMETTKVGFNRTNPGYLKHTLDNK